MNEEQATALCIGLLKDGPLRSLSICHSNLCSVEPDLLAKAVAGLQVVELSQTSLTTLQVTVILSTIAQTETLRLRSLHLSESDLTTVEEDTLVTAASRLDHLGLADRCLSPEAAGALLSALDLCPRLRSVDLSYTDLSTLAPSLLATTSKLTSLSLSGTCLRRHQATSLCSSLQQGSNLRSLQLSGNNLSLVEPELLACGLATLEEVAVYGCSLTTRQVNLLLGALLEDGGLRSLDLSCNNLSLVEPGLLATASRELEELRLSWSHLGVEQVTQIFLSLRRGSRLRSLDLSCNKLGLVTPGLLVTAVSQLEEVSLECCYLTEEQTGLLASVRVAGLRSLHLVANGGGERSVGPVLLLSREGEEEQQLVFDVQEARPDLQQILTLVSYCANN